jgi:hypothetical protein
VTSDSSHPEDSADDSDPEDLGAGERELLAGFDRLSPQGGLQWAFDDSMRRVAEPELETPDVQWKGLPDDLWERGRSAAIGQRFVGDVAGVIAEILAADSRAVAKNVSGHRFEAVWDALRYLAARVERLEARVDPLGFEAAEWSLPVADPSEWVEQLPRWLGAADGELPVVVGESGDGRLVLALARAGHRVRGVDPKGASVWGSLADSDGSLDIEMTEVVDHLRTIGDDRAAGVVLIGCVDRLDLAAKLELLDESFRVVGSGGVVVILTSDQSAWDERLSIPARDLTPGRPLHPETWMLLLHRLGAAEAVWHRASSGTVHAVVARLQP